MTTRKPDQDLELYRSLLEMPTEYKEGFGWSTVLGVIFCGLVMIPGAIFLSLMTGGSRSARAVASLCAAGDAS